ncbi:MAG: hypothetical protein WCY98_10295 [Castellaniella sp.]
MKFAFILLGIASATLTWRFGLPGRLRHASQHRGRLQRLLHSLGAGVAVYFTLMAIAMIWLQVQAA